MKIKKKIQYNIPFHLHLTFSSYFVHDEEFNLKKLKARTFEIKFKRIKAKEV